MNLRETTAELRLQIMEDLVARRNPRHGAWDAEVLAATKDRGTPQIGSTNYDPHAINFEFIFLSKGAAPIILRVRVPTEKRIVFLPVPSWVIESIWQGEVSGSYHFEPDAEALVQAFAECLAPENNVAIFGVKERVGRES